jgi:2-methylcitrate dehydratase
MKHHLVRVCPSRVDLPKAEQLAWKLASVATERVPIEPPVVEAVIDRIIDNAGVAAAALNRQPIVVARSQALARPRAGGATILGLPNTNHFHAEWAAWANTVAVRELDMHDVFLAKDYSHPADNIPALIAVAQQCGKSGADLLRGIVVAYEVQIALVKGMCLHEHKKDHIAHLAPSIAAGIGTLLSLDVNTIYQAIQHAVHVSFTSRQSRRGAITSWKAFAPAYVSKLAVEAIDYALRGGQSPSPIYEGEDGVIAAMLGGPKACYVIPLPEPGEPCLNILESYTKEYAAEYQAQALIDLAFRIRDKIPDHEKIKTITLYTSQHTHLVIGSGSDDPHKYDPNASRETLDHSAMYIFAVALEDGCWHHISSYLPERAKRSSTQRLWSKISTKESAGWTQRYNDPDPSKRAFGARAEILLNNGSIIDDELLVANAHPNGGHPFCRVDYMNKYSILTEGVITGCERERFWDLAERLPKLSAEEVRALNIQLPWESLATLSTKKTGIC